MLVWYLRDAASAFGVARSVPSLVTIVALCSIQLGTAPRRQNPFKLKFIFLECDLQLVMLVIVIVMKYHKFNYI